MRTRTFGQWSRDGYKIKKGSKSVGKSADGEYLFTEEQVEYLYGAKRRYPSYGDDCDMEEDYAMAEFFDIAPWGCK